MWNPERREGFRRSFAWVGSGIAAGIILAVAVFAIARSGDEEALPSPTVTAARPTFSPAPTPTASPQPTGEAPTPSPVVIIVTPAPTPRPPGPTPAPTGRPGPTPTARAVSDVDCSRQSDRQFCLAGSDSLVVVDGRLDSEASSRSDVDEGRIPLIEMTTEARKADGTVAGKGDEVDRLYVDVKVTNKTGGRTFVFPSQQVAVQLMRDGNVVFDPATSGEAFEMPPGASMTAEFTLPVRGDGTYEWKARTWWYEK